MSTRTMSRRTTSHWWNRLLAWLRGDIPCYYRVAVNTVTHRYRVEELHGYWFPLAGEYDTYAIADEIRNELQANREAQVSWRPVEAANEGSR